MRCCESVPRRAFRRRKYVCLSCGGIARTIEVELAGLGLEPLLEYSRLARAELEAIGCAVKFLEELESERSMEAGAREAERKEEVVA